MTGRRRAAFDPGRLDDLSDVLAPPHPATRDESRADPPEDPPTPSQLNDEPAPNDTPPLPEPAPTSTALTPASSSSGESTRTSSRPRIASAPARSSLNRQQRAPGGRIATAVRIPADVYQDVNDHLLSGVERPSYGQLVMWSVEDHRDRVIAIVEAALPDPLDRSPRGRRLAQDRIPIGLQLLASERADLDQLASEIAAGDVAAGRGVRVTRTDVATAALRVALEERTGRPSA